MARTKPTPVSLPPTGEWAQVQNRINTLTSDNSQPDVYDDQGYTAWLNMLVETIDLADIASVESTNIDVLAGLFELAQSVQEDIKMQPALARLPGAHTVTRFLEFGHNGTASTAPAVPSAPSPTPTAPLDPSSLYKKTRIERLQVYSRAADNVFSTLEATHTRIRSMFETIARVERDLGRREEREIQARIKAEVMEFSDNSEY